MSTTGPVFVVDYTDRPYEAVCDALDGWSGDRLTTRPGRRPLARVGAVDRITDHVTRVAMFEPDAVGGTAVAELRVIAVSTGHDALTELLVFADAGDNSPAERAAAVLRARAILEGAMHRVQLVPEPAAPRRAG
jgi:hypothetical protein